MMMKWVLLLALVVAVHADMIKKRQGDRGIEPSKGQDEASDDDGTDDDNSGDQDQVEGSGDNPIEDAENNSADLG